MNSTRRQLLQALRASEADPGNRIIAEISAKALQQNYKAIAALVPGQAILPMIKADAYGHGMDWAAETLAGSPDLYGVGVATLEEGQTLRHALGPRYRKTRILIFSGAIPWTEEKGHFCERHHLTPIIASDADWSAFLKGGWTDRLSYEIKFNTGMNRLGLGMGSLKSVARSLKDLAPEHHPDGVLSHLAMSEKPESKLSQSQLEKFRLIRAELSSAVPSAQFHLANSGAIWNRKEWGLDGMTDVVRPGISLYGVTPWKGAPERGIAPVMTLKAKVLSVHRLKRGESIGYSGAYTVTTDEPVFVAVLAAGYADGIKRSLGNKGFAWLDGRESRFLGNVSMDLCAVSCTARTQVGDWAELIGANVDAWAQAEAAGTIPYELLTSVSSRVKRKYG